ncbi:MAG: class I SAM-dependent methyltransferase [Patescibacteria group bacterium]
MSFLSSLLPRVVLNTSSRYNSDIRLIRAWGEYKLLVHGSPQSGSYIRMLWRRALQKIKTDELHTITTILVLGVGGGTVIELLIKRFPHAVIIAVDIDPTMMAIAKKYFGIDMYTNVRLECGDANRFVEHSAKKGMVFDLIVVDLFIGATIPEFVSSIPFLKNLHAIVRPGGHLVINYLRELEYQAKSDELCVCLSAIWKHTGDMKLYNNRFFFAG